MRSLFPSSYDRADVLMSAGCSTLVSASLILVVPRFGILLLEILLGLFFIGCALVARSRLRRRALGKDGPEKSKDRKMRWFDKYDVLMIGAVIVVQTCTAGMLRKAGLSEGTVNTLPLILFAGGILLKPRAMEFLDGRKKTQQAARIYRDPPIQSVGAVDNSEVLRQTVLSPAAKDGDLE
jgi:amino acid transporter